MQTSEPERARLTYGSFVALDAAIVYMETPKAACSSFKYLIAALSGVDVSNLPLSLMAAKTDEMAIHDRSVVAVPSLLDVSDDARTRALTSDDFLRFCVVRNPFRRLASAWLDRLLCHSLSPIAPILQHLSFPKYIADWSYLRAKFAEFVDHLYRHEAPHFSNHHWQRQHDLLLPHLMNYNLVVRLEELSGKLPSIIRHVEKRGLAWPGLPRMNETPFRFDSRLYTLATARKVAEMYALDFCKFGYSTRIDSRDAPAPLPDVELVTAMQKRNQRIFYLSLKARGMI